MRENYSELHERARKKQKEKNIAEGTKDSSLFLSPILSYQSFKIGSSVSNYLHCVKLKSKGDGKYTLDEYETRALGYHITLCCRESGFIESISFDEHCFFNGVDLIRMNIFDFMLMVNKEPDSVDVDWVPTKDDNHGQNQRCYCFYFYKSRVIQLWTWRKRIVFVSVYDYRN